ncbi:MAG: hypothetical protein KDE27_28275 [Planctomycetes bacterium]|nr:hypothetical protein [Planctomycetota bacterium]
MRARAAVLLLGAMVLPACAFANPANRPVWNAFEQNLVPESPVAFWASLPLTVPAGVGAVLVDTFVAHPIQVVGTAWDDTARLWQELPFAERYYTTSASLPFRAVASPVVFLGSFLGRSAFDWPSEADAAARREERDQRRRNAVLSWLGRIAAGDVLDARRRYPEVIDDELVEATRRALAGGGAHGRLLVYEAVAASEDPTIVDWLAALADPSAVVRYELIDLMPQSIAVPAEIRERLCADPDQAVRERASERWD